MGNHAAGRQRGSDVLKPRMLLLVKADYPDTAAALLSIIAQAGYRVEQIDRLPESLPGENTILIVHLLSTLHDRKDISGYEEFLRKYARLPNRDRIRLVVVSPPISEGPDRMVGYGTLVDCYVTEAAAPLQLASFLQRLCEDFDTKLPSPRDATRR